MHSAGHIIFSSDIFATQAYGGVSRYVTRLHRGLRDRGLRSTVLGGLYVTGYLEGETDVVGIRVPPLVPRRLRVVAGYALERAWLALRPGRFIYHNSYYSRWTPPPGVPVVVTIHDMIHEKLPQYLPATDPTAARKRKWCRAASLILAVSESTKRDLVEILGIDPGRILVTHLGVDTLPRGDGQRARVLNGDYLLYVGARRGYKNFSRLLQAFLESRPCRNLNLVCFGGGPRTREESAMLQRQAAGARVRFIHGGESLLRDHYAGAMAVVVPSLYEGFGLVTLEAMGQGCPVLCSNTSSLPEVVGDAAVTFDPHEAEAIGSALDSVVENDDLRKRLSGLGHRRAREFTWDKTVAKTVAGYRSLGVRLRP